MSTTVHFLVTVNLPDPPPGADPMTEVLYEVKAQEALSEAMDKTGYAYTIADECDLDGSYTPASLADALGENRITASLHVLNEYVKKNTRNVKDDPVGEALKDILPIVAKALYSRKENK